MESASMPEVRPSLVFVHRAGHDCPSRIAISDRIDSRRLDEF
jgi:hypothetical protein